MRRHVDSIFPFVGVPAMLLMAVTPSPAGTIYSSLAPSSTPCPPCRFNINATWETNVTFLATTFVTTGAGNLDQVVFPVFSVQAPISFGLYADANGRPGALLESWSVSVPGFPAQLETLTSALNPVLDANTPYWFVLTEPAANAVSLYRNNQGVAGGVWFGNSLSTLLEASPALPAPAIELDSTASTTAPEPSTGLDLAGGLLFAGLVRAVKRRRPVVDNGIEASPTRGAQQLEAKEHHLPVV